MALEWTIDLGAQEPRKRAVVGAVAIGVGALGVLVVTPWLALTGFALIILSNSEVFLKQYYKITENGVERKCGLSTTAMEWEQIKSVREDSDGVKLSPFESSRRSDPFRGVYLRFSQNNREAVLAKIHEHFHGDPSILGGGLDGGGAGQAL
ncbi:MAG: hypothetical protein JNK63_04025 [Chthonomonas sp.]|nr:hypothetical protein [Chthonomonas sp.]